MSFGSEIKRLRQDARISVQKIADLIGVDAERWRKWEDKNLTPRMEDTAIIENFFGMPLNKIGKLLSIKEFLNVPREVKQVPKKDTVIHHPMTNEVLLELIKSNFAQAEAHKVLSEANLILARNNENLITKMQSSADAAQETSVDVSASFADLLELLAEIASGKKFRSKQEALAELSKRVPVPQRKDV